MDAVTAITTDHRLLEHLSQRVREEEGDRLLLLTEIRARLNAHSTAEEEHVYPALLDDDEAVYHGQHEHREAEEKLAEAERLVGTEDFAAIFQEFVDAVREHVEEEREILPVLQGAVSGDRLEDLGRAFEKRRVAELRSLGIEEG